MMRPKLVYQRQNWSGLCIWRYLYLCHLSKFFLDKCAPWSSDLSLALNLKMSIIKLTRVSFGTPQDYMLQKCVSLSIGS